LGGCISERKLAANKANALVSTGPRTTAGKAMSSRNATKHGLLSEQAALPGESRRRLLALHDQLYLELRPVGVLEQLFVDRIVCGFWRLRRALHAEREAMKLKGQGDVRPLIITYVTGGDEGETDLDSSGADVQRSPDKRRQPGSLLAQAVANEQVEKILRYETTIERQIYRALHELQRLQAARKGARPLAPIAVDVDLGQGEVTA